MEQAIPPQSPKKKSRKKLYAVIGIVVIVVIIIAVLAIPKTFTIVNGGTVESLSAGQYYVSEFNTTTSGTLAGSVSATNGITFYLMTPSEYSSFVSSGSPNSYAFTSGHISSGSFNTNIVSGTWYAIFYNSNIITSTTLTINSLTFTS